MKIDVISEFPELERLAADWLDLCRRSPGTTPFQTPMWLLPWWRAFGSDELVVITGREGVRLDSLAPLTILRDSDSGESLGLFLGTGISDYLDVVGSADALTDQLGWLDCQAWDFQQLRPSSPLLAAATPRGWSEQVFDQDPCPILSLSDAKEDFEDLISPHFRKKIRYYRRALERSGEVRYERATPENLDEFLTALYELHKARWRQKGMEGVLGDDVVQQFHREVAGGMLGTDALRMYAIRLDGRIVAVFYGFSLGRTVYYYLSGYDPQLERLSIGTLLVAHAVEQAIHAGAHTFDFLRGAEEYKYAWGAKDRMNQRRQLFRT